MTDLTAVAAKLESVYQAIAAQHAIISAEADRAERVHGAFSAEAAAANDRAFDSVSRLADACLAADQAAAAAAAG